MEVMFKKGKGHTTDLAKSLDSKKREQRFNFMTN